MSERSRIPQLTINWVVTIAAFLVRVPPDLILAINWGVCQVSTVHSAIEAIRMRSVARFLRPTSFARPENAAHLFSSRERQAVTPAPTPMPGMETGTTPVVAPVSRRPGVHRAQQSWLRRRPLGASIRAGRSVNAADTSAVRVGVPVAPQGRGLGE